MAPAFDLGLLHALNRPAPPLLDLVLRALSQRSVLFVLDLGLALWAIWRGLRAGRPRTHALWVVAAVGLSIGAGDLLAVRAIKPWAARVRPCRAQPKQVWAGARCGSGQSMPSAHATDAAAAASALSLLAGPPGIAAWVLALGVGASRVYLGVHWPSDVAAGWLLGACVGGAVTWLLRAARARRASGRAPGPAPVPRGPSA